LDVADALADVRLRFDQSIIQPLMIPLPVKVFQKRGNGFAQGRLAEEDQAVEAQALLQGFEDLGAMPVIRRHLRETPRRLDAERHALGAEVMDGPGNLIGTTR
jgi:hypothetical protein